MFRFTKIQIEDFLHDCLVLFRQVYELAAFPVTILGIGTVAVLVVTVWAQFRRVPDLDSIRNYHGADSVQIYDSKDHLICSVSLGGTRIAVPLTQIPRYVQFAVLAAEDHRFYEHPGLDLSGVSRAFLANIHAGRFRQGGSTITQQLVKNLFFCDEERTIHRKVAEMLLATSIEHHYTKDELLAMYLNEIYFGSGANGIQQASLKYFGKDVSDLSLAEGAFLAGLIRAPSFLGSSEHRAEAFHRQRQVLQLMVDYEFITAEECYAAQRSNIVFKTVNINSVAKPFNKYPYYVSFVMDFLRNRFTDADMRREGLRVYTNLDQVAQEAAERTLAREIGHAPNGVTNEALISIAVKDSAIRAIVGGAHDYWSSQWNSATNPHTVGSLFKPFVYLTAFMSGALTPESVIDDSPITIRLFDGTTYSPQNFDHKFMGKITVRKALALSRNVCAVKVAQMVGVNNVVNTARLAGIRGDLPGHLAIALGSCAISPLELAGAYGTFARGGSSIRPWAIRRIENRGGEVLASYGPIINRGFPEDSVGWLVDVLHDVVQYGTGTAANLGGRPVAGKTGTADKARDIWFVGFTPDMVTAVWGGNDHNLPIAGHNITGGTVMAHVWREYNQAYYARNPMPPGHLWSLKCDGTGDPGAAGNLMERILHGQANSYKVPEPVQRPHATSRRPRRVARQTQGAGDSYYQGPVQSNKGVTEYVWAR